MERYSPLLVSRSRNYQALKLTSHCLRMIIVLGENLNVHYVLNLFLFQTHVRADQFLHLRPLCTVYTTLSLFADSIST